MLHPPDRFETELRQRSYDRGGRFRVEFFLFWLGGRAIHYICETHMQRKNHKGGLAAALTAELTELYKHHACMQPKNIYQVPEGFCLQSAWQLC